LERGKGGKEEEDTASLIDLNGRRGRKKREIVSTLVAKKKKGGMTLGKRKVFPFHLAILKKRKKGGD